MLRSGIIFLADDDCEDVELFRDALTEICAHCNLFSFPDGYQLLEGLRNCNKLPDLIFVDVNMPTIDGFEALVQIRQDRKLSAIPTIIYSTSSNQDHISKAYALGASSYIKKPNDFKTLKEILKKILVLHEKF
ncbi:MAG: hypothetical protein BGO88_08395 [Flavobacterium sp. 38-13]|uniref:response regulator n=1 Tax=Flavobacterium sp. 38-13 TaxID=1896168 RepID=UPI00095BB918|nr:response regulator [Flavobacterium sp. 38-13]OJX49765.1 MAG: hypothetical protein BGO88_08395 [Flavobacterium sp. 38-13]